jgi:hypothetical protein
MADNVNVTPGAGATLAADDIGGVLYGRTKLVIGADGVNDGDVSSANPMPVTGALTDTQLRATAVPVSGAIAVSIGGSDVSASNPLPVIAYGELVEAIEALRIAVQALTRSGLGQAMPDNAARLRVAIDAISASLTLATITTVGTVTTVGTMTNQTQVGGLAATEQIPSLMRLGADSVRRNISVT